MWIMYVQVQSLCSAFNSSFLLEENTIHLLKVLESLVKLMEKGKHSRPFKAVILQLCIRYNITCNRKTTVFAVPTRMDVNEKLQSITKILAFVISTS